MSLVPLTVVAIAFGDRRRGLGFAAALRARFITRPPSPQPMTGGNGRGRKHAKHPVKMCKIWPAHFTRSLNQPLGKALGKRILRRSCASGSWFQTRFVIVLSASRDTRDAGMDHASLRSRTVLRRVLPVGMILAPCSRSHCAVPQNMGNHS